MRPLLVGVAILALVATAGAQQKSFEVASVKSAPPFAPGPGATRPSLIIAGTHFDVHAYGLMGLLTWAFEPGPGAFAYPDWLRTSTDRVDIQAVIPAGSSKSEIQAMLRTLLADRMGLKSHVEPRVVPSFDLVVAPGGIRMTAVEEADQRDDKFPQNPYELDNRSTDGETRTIVSLVGGNRTLTARSNFVTTQVPIDARPVKYTFEAVRITMDDFVRELTFRVEKPVVNATGLTGVYQFKIDVPIPLRIQQMVAQTPPRNGDRAQAELDIPVTVSVPKELEKLGLQLVERKAPINVIVIDNINRTPTGN